MNQSDEIKFAEIMATMGAVFTPLNDIQLDIYFDCLKDFPIADIEFAAKHILKTVQFTGKFPSVSDFIQAIQNKGGSLDTRAEFAWTALLWAIEHVGHMASVQFEDPIIHDTVRAMGGWIRVCSADGDVYNEEWHTKYLQWRRKDFISMYKKMAQHNDRPLTYLIGLQEAENKGIYDDFIPRLTKIAGKPGQYVALPGIRHRELPEPEDEVSKIIKQIEDEKDFPF